MIEIYSDINIITNASFNEYHRKSIFYLLIIVLILFFSNVLKFITTEKNKNDINFNT